MAYTQAHRLGRDTEQSMDESEPEQPLSSCLYPEPASSPEDPQLKMKGQHVEFNHSLFSDQIVCFIFVVPIGLAPTNTSEKFLLGVRGKELM